MEKIIHTFNCCGWLSVEHIIILRNRYWISPLNSSTYPLNVTTLEAISACEEAQLHANRLAGRSEMLFDNSLGQWPWNDMKLAVVTWPTNYANDHEKNEESSGRGGSSRNPLAQFCETGCRAIIYFILIMPEQEEGPDRAFTRYTRRELRPVRNERWIVKFVCRIPSVYLSIVRKRRRMRKR